MKGTKRKSNSSLQLYSESSSSSSSSSLSSTTTTTTTTWINDVGFLFIFVIVFIAVAILQIPIATLVPIILPVQGAAIPIRTGIPIVSVRDRNRNRDKGRGRSRDGNHNEKISTPLRGNFPSSLWMRNKKERTTTMATRSDQQQQQQQHGISILGLLFTGATNGGMGPFGSKNNKLIVVGAAATATVYKVQKVLRSEAVHRATYFWWKVGPMVTHYKFTKWWFRKTKAPLEKRDKIYNDLHDKYAPIAYEVAVELKGLYVKLAQITSSRPDFVPRQYINLFVEAQDSLPQWPIEDVKEIIDTALRSDNDKYDNTDALSFAKVFEDIDEIALGSASIGQCHKATIKGKYARELFASDDNIATAAAAAAATPAHNDAAAVDVAVKVMHPGAEQRFRHDFQVFRWLCKVALTGWEPILDECYRQIMSEFDYRKEANSLDTIRKAMLVSPFRNTIRVPKPIFELCGKEVLVMELLDGEKLSDSLENELSEILGEKKSKQLLERKRLELILGKDKMKALAADTDGDSDSDKYDDDGTEENILSDCGWKTKLRLLGLFKRAQKTIDLLVDVQGYQILRDGFFQGDPHPGNIMELRKKGGKTSYINRGPLLGLIDYGQTKALTDKERLGVARVILALGGEGESDDDDDDSLSENGNTKVERVATAMRNLGFVTKHNNSKVLAQYAGLFFDSDEDGKRLYDCATPQSYFKLLTELDPLVEVPDVAIIVARCGFILRGMGTLLGKQIKTSKRWSVYAKQALKEKGEEE